MAKAINHFSRMGNDGYEYAMRADGKGLRLPN